jgi:hypothetical protein
MPQKISITATIKAVLFLSVTVSPRPFIILLLRYVVNTPAICEIKA